MKRNHCRWLARLSDIWELFCVPAAAALVGWLCAPVLARWILEGLAIDGATRVAWGQSALFMHGARTALAALLFFVAWRYLA